MNKKMILGMTLLSGIIGTSVFNAPAANAQGYFYTQPASYRIAEGRREVAQHRIFERRLAQERRFERRFDRRLDNVRFRFPVEQRCGF